MFRSMNHVTIYRCKYIKNLVSVPPLGDILQSGDQVAARPNLTSESCAATWGERNIQKVDSHVWIHGHQPGSVIMPIDHVTT